MNPAGVQPYCNPITSLPVDTSIPIPLKSLKDRTLVITGGASGIGASIAVKVAENGGNVIIGDVNTTLGQELVAYIRRTTKSDNHHCLHLDVTLWQSQVSFFAEAVSLSPHGGLDCIIANAGIANLTEQKAFEEPIHPSLLDTTKAPPYRTFSVNALGVLYTTDIALSYLKHNPGSSKCELTASDGPRDRHLLLVSSIAGVAAVPTQSIYAAAKHAVVGLFRALRVTAPITAGVRVNMINPYFTDTPILGPEGPLVMAGAAMARIDDVTNAAVRLIADRSIVGRALLIGSRATKAEVEAAGVDWVENDQYGNAVRDIMGDDWKQTDVFVRRLIGVTNLVSAGKGWVGLVADIIAFFVHGMFKLMGR
ncbi:uncharacterized protein HMPREF1541_09636 [Cyphellophora europaea CBS 101466]|uniref:Uncharacterized protein n=1 Tax=Cyphellophora europaea (strain CBS 101466) TaxID=1220924 RepID=W2SCP5_CYPE1|nr:uncharacterized protein HMPREF1541_09636 [Cyphellophora europaea CBS 101466]ETN45803.1 hypothetical protein HMPREF1541_09636 [Cyphellophora europaea CBS 101466]